MLPLMPAGCRRSQSLARPPGPPRIAARPFLGFGHWDLRFFWDLGFRDLGFFQALGF
jgi:hypothetical protein